MFFFSNLGSNCCSTEWLGPHVPGQTYFDQRNTPYILTDMDHIGYQCADFVTCPSCFIAVTRVMSPDDGITLDEIGFQLKNGLMMRCLPPNGQPNYEVSDEITDFWECETPGNKQLFNL